MNYCKSVWFRNYTQGGNVWVFFTAAEYMVKYFKPIPKKKIKIRQQ